MTRFRSRKQSSALQSLIPPVVSPVSVFQKFTVFAGKTYRHKAFKVAICVPMIEHSGSLCSLGVSNSSALKRGAKPRGTACPDDLHFLLPPPRVAGPNDIFCQPDDRFVDRVIPANHSAGGNMKLPICREMDSQVNISKQYYAMRCLLDGGEGQYAEKSLKGGIHRNLMEKIIVDFVVVCLKSNSENLRGPLTFHRSCLN